MHNNFEPLDIYDENKNKTGKILIRHKDTLNPGEFIISVQAIIINSKKQILISQRSELKDRFPLKWECNGGAVLSGEDVVEGLVREIYEELGVKLKLDEVIHLKTAKNKYRFKEIYVLKKDIKIEDIKFLDAESIKAKWVDINEFMSMFKNGDIIPTIEFDDKDFEKCLSLLKLN